MGKPIGFWKCTKSIFSGFTPGKIYECKLDQVGSPRIYTNEGAGNWAPYWSEANNRFCYPKYELNFEYVSGVKEDSNMPEVLVINGVTYVRGLNNG